MGNLRYKFRVWDRDNREMRFYGGIFNHQRPYVERSSMPQIESCPEYNDVSEPMQYTGLRDKNGVEIYESDVCRTHRYKTQPDGSQILSDKYKEYYNVVIKYNAKSPFCGFTIQEWFEVVGNIHENPELLETQS